MLRAIPSSALDRCVDGARIPASAMHVAHDAARMEEYARRRAGKLIADAIIETQALRRQAAEDAYREASIQAGSVLLGLIHNVGQLRSALLEGVMAQVRQCLRAHCAEAGFATAWIERACQLAMDDHAVPVRVQVPLANDGLFVALLKTLGDSVALERAEVACLRLEQGDLVLEYDPEHVVFDAAARPPTPDAQALHDGLAAVASRYADAVVRPRNLS